MVNFRLEDMSLYAITVPGNGQLCPPYFFPLFLANIVLNSKLCCCVAGEHNSGFDPPENMFFMCNRGGNVQRTTI